MTDGREEIGQGPDRPPVLARLPVPPWWARVLAAVVVALLGGALLLHQARHAKPKGPSTAPSAASSGSPSPTAPVVADFNLGTFCKPVTDGRTTLLLAFTVINLSQATAKVTGVEPVLPLGGLRVVSTDVSGGSCGAPRVAPAGLDVVSGGSLLVTFRFLLPPGCPQPLPVQVAVQVQTQAGVVADVVPVYPDLGSIAFHTCPGG
jgi:hypothetical protein